MRQRESNPTGDEKRSVLPPAVRWQASGYEDRHLAAAEKLAEDMASLPLEDRRTPFRARKSLCGPEQHERAFRHLLEGNALKRCEIVNDERGVGLLDRIRTYSRPS